MKPILVISLLLIFAGAFAHLPAQPPGTAGVYTLFSSAPVDYGGGGKLVVSEGGAFTCKFTLISSRGSIRRMIARGQLDAEGKAGVTLFSNKSGELEFFTVNYVSATNTFNCVFEADSPGSPFPPYPFTFIAHRRAEAGELEGKYTAVLYPREYWPSEADAARLEGAGWAVLQVRPDGNVKVIGHLANNRAFTASSWLNEDGAFWLFNETGWVHSRQRSTRYTRYAYLDMISGSVTLRSTEEQDGSGRLYWRVSGERQYSVKFVYPSELAVELSRYTTPDDNHDTARTPYTVSLTGGEIGSPVLTSFTLVSTATGLKARELAPPLLSMAFPAEVSLDGSFRGSFQLAGEDFYRPFSGVFLQKQGFAAGYFKGERGAGRQTGLIEMEPAAVP